MIFAKILVVVLLAVPLIDGGKLWQYRLWSFQGRDTKLERFFHKNQNTQKEIIEF